MFQFFPKLEKEEANLSPKKTNVEKNENEKGWNISGENTAGIF
jgi:hypothetical protein